MDGTVSPSHRGRPTHLAPDRTTAGRLGTLAVVMLGRWSFALAALFLGACTSASAQDMAEPTTTAAPPATATTLPDTTAHTPDDSSTITEVPGTIETVRDPSRDDAESGAATATDADAESEVVSESTTTVPATTTTTEPPALDVHDAACVVEVQTGDSLGGIVSRFDDDTVTIANVMAENGLSDETIHPNQLLDVCVDNGLDDVTGEQRLERNAAILASQDQQAVVRQQEHLNTLFDGYGIAPLLVDGISGPVTRQRLCAARMGLGLPISTEDLVPGSLEELVILNASALRVPFTSSILSPRWILIDQTCQIMFVGEGAERISFVFPTSTGEEGHHTRPQDRTPAYRYNPASDNNGWHDSTTFPSAEDNPLNGNMYKPLYFDRGQAIHGANNVPTSPQSKGCARLRVEHMESLVSWLGLEELRSSTYDHNRIGVTVNVQGAYVSR